MTGSLASGQEETEHVDLALQREKEVSKPGVARDLGSAEWWSLLHAMSPKTPLWLPRPPLA